MPERTLKIKLLISKIRRFHVKITVSKVNVKGFALTTFIAGRVFSLNFEFEGEPLTMLRRRF